MPACALMLWTILPALCMTLCGAKVCCEPATRVAQPEVAKCSHCSESKGWVQERKPGDCCAWIAKRTDSPTIVAKAAWSVSLVAVLPEDVPTVTEQTAFESVRPPDYTGLAPPGPVACRLSARAPPIG